MPDRVSPEILAQALGVPPYVVANVLGRLGVSIDYSDGSYVARELFQALQGHRAPQDNLPKQPDRSTRGLNDELVRDLESNGLSIVRRSGRNGMWVVMRRKNGSLIEFHIHHESSPNHYVPMSDNSPWHAGADRWCIINSRDQNLVHVSYVPDSQVTELRKVWPGRVDGSFAFSVRSVRHENTWEKRQSAILQENNNG